MGIAPLWGYFICKGESVARTKWIRDSGTVVEENTGVLVDESGNTLADESGNNLQDDVSSDGGQPRTEWNDE